MTSVNRSEHQRPTTLWSDALPGRVSPDGPRSLDGGAAARSSSAVLDGVEGPGRTWLTGADLVDGLLHWEGLTRHMYLDTRGHVTVGIGNLLPSAEAAAGLPFIDARTGRAATRDEIAAAFAYVEEKPEGMRASRYAGATTLRLPEATVRELAVERLDREFLPALRRQFAGFDEYPASAQRALVDMIYNLGPRGLSRFENLRAACEAGDWARAAEECGRSSSRAERNEWTRSLFLEAARAVG